MNNRDSVFVSYSHLDKNWLEKFREIFAPDIRNERISYWDDEKIDSGDDWFIKICTALDKARVAILLVSPNFLKSSFIMTEELPRIFNAADNGLSIIWIPIYGEFESFEDLKVLKRLKQKQAFLDMKAPLSSFSEDEQKQKIINLCRIIQKKLGEKRLINGLPFLSIHQLFKGRSLDMLQIEDHFNDNLVNDKSLYPLILNGGSGIGKTRLAHEYAYKHLYEFSAILFISAGSPEEIENNIIKLGKHDLLDLPEYFSQNKNERYSAVIRWFQHSKNWLLIIDNVDTPESVSEVKKLIPILGSGQVIITSTYTRWGKGILKIELKTLPVKEAMEIINEATENERDSLPNDKEKLRKLVNILGCLPLAITHASSYISNLQISYQKYIEIFENSFSNLINYYDEKEMDYDPTTLKTISTTYSVSIEQLGSMEKAILRMASILAPLPIQISMLEECYEETSSLEQLWIEKEGNNKSSKEALEAIAELAKFSLITRNKGLFSIHRFEHSILRNQIPENDFEDWYSQVRSLIIKYGPEEIPEDPKLWDLWDILYPHVIELTSSKYEHVQDKSQIILNDYLACYYFGKGQFKESLKTAIKAYEIAKKVHKHDTYSFARILVNTGENFNKNNKPDEAEKLFREALLIEENLFGKQSLTVADTLNYIGLSLNAQGKTNDAKEIYEKALKIYDQNETEADKHNFAKLLGNLATIYSYLNINEKADASFKRAIEYYNHPESIGPYHTHTLICCIQYATFLTKTEQTLTAEELLKGTFEICKEKLSIQHHVTIWCGNSYSEVLMKNNKTIEAADVLLSLFNTDQEQQDSSFNNVCYDSITLNNIALKLRNIGLLDKAENLSSKALEIDIENYSEDHPKIPHRLNNLCTILLLEEKYSEVKKNLLKAWRLKNNDHDITSLRILFVRLTVAFIEKSPIDLFIGQIKTLLGKTPLPDKANIVKKWDIDFLFKHINSKIEIEVIDFLKKLSEVINDTNLLSILTDNIYWKSYKNISLYNPWPQ